MENRGRLPVTLAAMVLAVLAVGATAGLTGALPFADSGDGEAVVEDVSERYENAETYAADMTVTATNGSATYTRNLSVVTASPNSSRLTLADDAGDTVLGTNGTVAWVYDEANDTARVYQLDKNRSAPGALPGNATWNRTHDANETGDWNVSRMANLSTSLAENVTATVVDSETVRGTETTVVRLDPENESREGTTTLWATDDDRLLRLRTSHGENVTTVDLFDQQFNASVHESTFRPPTDATVTVAVNERYDTFAAAQDATSVTLARLDRPGYEFVEAATVTRGGLTVTTQQYVRENASENTTVGLVTTADSLPYESENGTSVTVAGENATYVERDGGGFVYWTDDGVTRGVAADLSRAALLELASDVRS
jgi:outer membrane lipoprotein-sorting protein